MLLGTTEDTLVYYASKESQVPKGRVTLSECTLGALAALGLVILGDGLGTTRRWCSLVGGKEVWS